MERTSRDAKIQRSIEQALALLNQMDDDVTERGGDEDEGGRRQLAKIRRAKAHLRRAQSAAEVDR